MLRASSPGLTFTHGIIRFSLLQRHRYLHKQLGRDVVLLVHGIPRPHSTTKIRLAEKVPVVRPSLELSSPTRPPATLPTPTEDTSSTETEPQATTPCDSYDNTRPVTPVLAPHSGFPQKLKVRPGTPADLAYIEHCRRQPLYEMLAHATDVDEAWKIYQELISVRPAHVKHIIPQKYLHGFVALLVARSKWQPPHKTRTQRIFHRLLAVLNTIYYSGGQVRLWEWNALMECAGRGWRKTRLEDYSSALSIYQDMVANRAPGSSLSDDLFVSFEDQARVTSQPVKPDIVTYTTLLNIAGRTLNPTIVASAEQMLVSSGVPPNRITYLAYIRFHARRGYLTGVRSVLSRMANEGMELGMDGLNACIWAYARNGRLNISASIYKVLRHRLFPSQDPDLENDIRSAKQELDDLEGITISAGLQPDAVTYYTLVQTYAYHGQLYRALDVFEDMMTSPQPVTGPLEDMDAVISGPVVPNPVLPIFRALFLGFARHAELPSHSSSTTWHGARGVRQSTVWTLGQLHTLFEHFVELPQDAKPNSRTVYWLLVAYAITSGYNREILRKVWERLSGRYGVWWDGRVHQLRKKIYADEFDEVYFKQLRARRDGRPRGS